MDLEFNYSVCVRNTLPKPELQTRAPNPVSQATSPACVNEAPDAYASAASELWDVMCALW